MARNVVVFPAPFEPSNTTTLPSGTSRLTLRKHLDDAAINDVDVCQREAHAVVLRPCPSLTIFPRRRSIQASPSGTILPSLTIWALALISPIGNGAVVSNLIAGSAPSQLFLAKGVGEHASYIASPVTLSAPTFATACSSTRSASKACAAA